MHFNRDTGIWSGQRPKLDGHYYRYAVEVFVRGVGLVRNLVTDPYSISLTTDSKRSYIADLDDRRLQAGGLGASRRAAPSRRRPTCRSTNCTCATSRSTTPTRAAGRTAASTCAFTWRELATACATCAALAQAGMTDVHLLPVFDIATVPEAGCVTPNVPARRTRCRSAAGGGQRSARRRLLQLGLRPVPLHRAGRQLRQRRRPTAPSASSSSARW